MEPIASYLRSHRRKSGFSLDELAQILGSVSAAQISRHERSLSVPGLLVTLGYEAFFEVPISEPFPGLYGTINAGIEERLRE
jgi:transcriptional regulator with XRE-family HTH domain